MGDLDGWLARIGEVSLRVNRWGIVLLVVVVQYRASTVLEYISYIRK